MELESSHDVDRPLGARTFFPVAGHGFGDPANGYPHSMAWFRNHLYVGVTRYTYYAVRPYDLDSQFAVFPVNLPEYNWQLDWRAQIWRFDPSAETWEKTYVSPMCMGSEGFEVPRHIGFRDMAVFQGESDPEPALYTVSWGSHMGQGPFVLRCTDGIHFAEAAPSERRSFGTQTLRALTAFKGRLYTIPTGRDSGTDGAHTFNYATVLESADPHRGGWRPVSEPNFGDAGNVMLFDMTVFNGFLYVSTMNPYEGFQLWKTDAEGTPPYRWKKVITHGAYRGNLNEIGCSMCVFKDSLYVGGAIYAGGHDRVYNIGPGRPELLRIHPDDSWELLVGEPRYTPEGLRVPLSGRGAGFDNPFTGYIWRMCAHDGWLYVGSLVWSPWLPFARYDKMQESMQGLLHARRLERFMRDSGGFDLWRSKDGCRWVPVTQNGFGNPFNCGVRTMVSTPYGLFVGAVNQFGPEVAVKRTAGWRYEYNVRGGVEIWLGRHATPRRHAASAAKMPEGPGISTDPKDEITVSEMLDEFYEKSGWRHVGFWREDISSTKDACENLMEELLAFTRPPIQKRARRPLTSDDKKRLAQKFSVNTEEDRRRRSAARSRESVLDLGCGLGETTRYLLKYFEPGGIFGITNREEELPICRNAVAGVRFDVMKLPKLKFKEDTFDKVLSVEGPSKYGDLKRTFKEILRVLKPGGQVICSDRIPAEKEGASLGHTQEYKDLLERAGFDRVAVIDVTEQSMLPFQKQLKLYAWKKSLSISRDASEIERAIESAIGGVTPSYHYILISAIKRT